MRGYGGGPNTTSLHPRQAARGKRIVFIPGVGYRNTGGTELAFAVGGASALAMTALGAATVKRPRSAEPKPIAEPVAGQIAA